MKIMNTIWFTPGPLANISGGCIGIVLVDWEEGEGVQAYIGIGKGGDEKIDQQTIADWGAKLDAGTLQRLLEQMQQQ